MLFDLVVLGTEPAGLKAAQLAAEDGRRVAVVNDPENFGRFPTGELEQTPAPAIRHFSGSAKFLTSDSVEIRSEARTHCLRARRFLLACGSRPKRPPHIPFDGVRILDCDEAGLRTDLPERLLLVGAGEHGLACAGNLIEQGRRVSVVDASRDLHPQAAARRHSKFWQCLREARCPVQWGTTVLGAEVRSSSAIVFYDNGAIESFGGVIFAVGRIGCTRHLDLPRRDFLLDESLRVWCNDFGQTEVPSIYAVGSVVGFPRFPGSPEEEARQILPHLLTMEAVPPRPAFLRSEACPSRC